MPDSLTLVRRLFFTGSLLASGAALCAADDVQTERISAAYVLVTGHLPTTQEITALHENSSASVAELITHLTQNSAGDPSNREKVARQAYEDCFGIAPSADQLARTNSTYAAQLKQHLQDLAAHRDDYAQVVQRAYQRVIRREPYPEEVTYWNRYDVVPYALLSAAIENWARRNQPGLMVTSGEATVSVNSLYLIAVRLSPTIADEVAEVLGSPRTQDDSDRARATERTVLSPGGAQLLSNGGIAFVAAGRLDE